MNLLIELSCDLKGLFRNIYKVHAFTRTEKHTLDVARLFSLEEEPPINKRDKGTLKYLNSRRGEGTRHKKVHIQKKVFDIPGIFPFNILP